MKQSIDRLLKITEDQAAKKEQCDMLVHILSSKVDVQNERLKRLEDDVRLIKELLTKSHRMAESSPRREAAREAREKDVQNIKETLIRQQTLQNQKSPTAAMKKTIEQKEDREIQGSTQNAANNEVTDKVNKTSTAKDASASSCQAESVEAVNEKEASDHVVKELITQFNASQNATNPFMAASSPAML